MWFWNNKGGLWYGVGIIKYIEIYIFQSLPGTIKMLNNAYIFDAILKTNINKYYIQSLSGTVQRGYDVGYVNK